MLKGVSMVTRPLFSDMRGGGRGGQIKSFFISDYNEIYIIDCFIYILHNSWTKCEYK